jgi:hypothetical protein
MVMCNSGLFDRALRVILGFALIALALSGVTWAWVGLVPLVTGFIGFCPLYAVLGLNTGCKTAE